MQHYMENNSEMEIYGYMGGGAMWPTAELMNYTYGSGGGGTGYYPATTVAMGMINGETEEAAAAASRVHHKEAEKRRRERINSHLDRLRSLLPCTSKTDKATLLSKVVQRVSELKRQTSELLDLDNLLIPSENDEFSVIVHNNNNIDNQTNNDQSSYYYDDDNNNNNNNDDDDNNKIMLKASLCCEDRPDLFSDLNGVLDSLNLKTVRAEISSIGGRVQSVLIVSADNVNGQSEECAVFLRDALKGIVQRSGSEERLKRRRKVFDSDC